MLPAMWVLVVVFISGDTQTVIFPTAEACLRVHDEIVWRLQEAPQSDFAFAKQPYGAVSPCVRLQPIKRMA